MTLTTKGKLVSKIYWEIVMDDIVARLEAAERSEEFCTSNDSSAKGERAE